MPNYVAHELFGAQVKEGLAPSLRRVVEEESSAFRCGLYGPDPLLFLPGGLAFSRLLHGTWRTQSGARMQGILQHGSAGEQSFALGYLCHLMLDDVCHQRIYALMREQGLSHRMLEVGLDWTILDYLGCERFHSPGVPGKKRVSHLAADLIAPVKSLDYRVGLSGMALLCSQMTRVGKMYRKRLTDAYQRPVAELFGMLEHTVGAVVSMVEGLQAGLILPGAALPVTA